MATIEQIAEVCHEANRGYQSAFYDFGIPVARSWDDIDDEFRDSVRQGVKGIQEGNTPEESHQGWIDFKVAHGWKYGLLKNEVLKEHPCLVPYDELPEDQRRKDDLFQAIVKVLS
jgi:hypothetical protein